MNNLTHAQPLVGAASGRWTAALGLPMMAFPAGPAVMEALSAGTLLAGFMGPSAAVNAFVRSRGKRGLVLRGNASGGASLVVQRDLPLSAPEHLRGRLLTASQIASTPDVSLRAYLAQHRLAPRDRGGDVVLLPMPNTEAFVTLKRRQIAGVWAQEPWASRMVAAGARRLLDERELWPHGRFPTSLLVTTRRAIDEQPAKIERLLGLLNDETARLRRSPDGGFQEASQALSKAIGRALPPAILQDAWGRFELTTDPMPEALAETARRMKAIGYLPAEGSLDGMLLDRSAKAEVTR
jgi:NitT/TauT family transport system substrate-binding protein